VNISGNEGVRAQKRIAPSQAYLREWFDYDLETGVFTWRKASFTQRRRLGRIAGFKVQSGYVLLWVPGFGNCMAHRLAWIYINGALADGTEIDHIDCVRSNNAISNLRVATRSQQNQNRRIRCNNRSGLKGAFYHARGKKNWRSAIKVNGQLIYLGLFRTPEEAHATYAAAATKYFGEFARAS
jgi:hypothetical protein